MAWVPALKVAKTATYRAVPHACSDVPFRQDAVPPSRLILPPPQLPTTTTYCSSLTHSQKSLINFSAPSLLTPARSLSSSLSRSPRSSLSPLYLFQFAGALSASPISAPFSSFLPPSPPFLIGRLLNPSLCAFVSLSASPPLSFPPSLPLILCWLLCLFSPPSLSLLCALTGLFLSLIADGRLDPAP